jgi:putative heme-binding domain-containing protein
VRLILGDRDAAEAIVSLVRNRSGVTSARRQALEDLLEQKHDALPGLLFELLDEKELRGVALRGLAGFNDPAVADAILSRYGTLSYEEKQDALATLSARPATALALLEAVRNERVPRADFTAAAVRQLQQMSDKTVRERVSSIWGVIGGKSSDAQPLIKEYKQRFKPEVLAQADRSHGRAIYTRTCAACHRLFGEGGRIGPEITGANRMNLDYLLENLFDPNALVAKDYQLTVLETADGRVLSGLVLEENEAVLKLQTQNEQVTVPRGDIVSRRLTPVSMMPVGLWKDLNADDIRDLVGYLSSPRQVPLPAGFQAEAKAGP